MLKGDGDGLDALDIVDVGGDALALEPRLQHRRADLVALRALERRVDAGARPGVLDRLYD
jgi:hypothetical protein